MTLAMHHDRVPEQALLLTSPIAGALVHDNGMDMKAWTKVCP